MRMGVNPFDHEFNFNDNKRHISGTSSGRQLAESAPEIGHSLASK